MNQVKRIAGALWILLSLAAAYYCITVFGWPKLVSDKQEDHVFGIIILFVLTPIIVGGLFTFGFYALKGEYDNNE